MHKIEINERVYATIEQDEDAQAPEWYESVKIAYRKSSRHTLGNHGVSIDEMQEIEEKITSGELVGLPVYAYVHSGVALSTSPFGDPWDSGQSGFVFADPKRMAKEFGEDSDLKEILKSAVKDLSTYLQGDVYVIRVFVDGEEKDVVGGHYGFDYAVTCAKEMGEEYVKLHEKVVKVVLKTGVSKLKVELGDASISKLEACVDLAAKVGGFIVMSEGSIEHLPGGCWHVTRRGVKLASSVISAGNNIETKKFRKMLYGIDVEGFEKLEDGTYVELD